MITAVSHFTGLIVSYCVTSASALNVNSTNFYWYDPSFGGIIVVVMRGATVQILIGNYYPYFVVYDNRIGMSNRILDCWMVQILLLF